MGEDTSHFLKVTGNTISLAGHIGIPELKPTQDALRDLVKRSAGDVNVDLSGLDYMSSSYIGLFVGTAAELNSSGGKMTILANGQVLRLLKLAGVDKIVALQDR